MKKTGRAIAAFVIGIALAAAACAVDTNMVAFSILMIASLASGIVFVINLVSSTNGNVRDSETDIISERSAA